MFIFWFWNCCSLLVLAQSNIITLENVYVKHGTTQDNVLKKRYLVKDIRELSIDSQNAELERLENNIEQGLRHSMKNSSFTLNVTKLRLKYLMTNVFHSVSEISFDYPETSQTVLQVVEVLFKELLEHFNMISFIKNGPLFFSEILKNGVVVISHGECFMSGKTRCECFKIMLSTTECPTRPETTISTTEKITTKPTTSTNPKTTTTSTNPTTATSSTNPTTTTTSTNPTTTTTSTNPTTTTTSTNPTTTTTSTNPTTTITSTDPTTKTSSSEPTTSSSTISSSTLLTTTTTKITTMETTKKHEPATTTKSTTSKSPDTSTTSGTTTRMATSDTTTTPDTTNNELSTTTIQTTKISSTTTATTTTVVLIANASGAKKDDGDLNRGLVIGGILFFLLIILIGLIAIRCHIRRERARYLIERQERLSKTDDSSPDVQTVMVVSPDIETIELGEESSEKPRLARPLTFFKPFTGNLSAFPSNGSFKIDAPPSQVNTNNSGDSGISLLDVLDHRDRNINTNYDSEESSSSGSDMDDFHAGRAVDNPIFSGEETDDYQYPEETHDEDSDDDDYDFENTFEDSYFAQKNLPLRRGRALTDIGEASSVQSGVSDDDGKTTTTLISEPEYATVNKMPHQIYDELNNIEPESEDVTETIPKTEFDPRYSSPPSLLRQGSVAKLANSFDKEKKNNNTNDSFGNQNGYQTLTTYKKPSNRDERKPLSYRNPLFKEDVKRFGDSSDDDENILKDRKDNDFREPVYANQKPKISRKPSLKHNKTSNDNVPLPLPRRAASVPSRKPPSQPPLPARKPSSQPPPPPTAPKPVTKTKKKPPVAPKTFLNKSNSTSSYHTKPTKYSKNNSS